MQGAKTIFIGGGQLDNHHKVDKLQTHTRWLMCYCHSCKYRNRRIDFWYLKSLCLIWSFVDSYIWLVFWRTKFCEALLIGLSCVLTELTLPFVSCCDCLVPGMACWLFLCNHALGLWFFSPGTCNWAHFQCVAVVYESCSFFAICLLTLQLRHLEGEETYHELGFIFKQEPEVGCTKTPFWYTTLYPEYMSFLYKTDKEFTRHAKIHH